MYYLFWEYLFKYETEKYKKAFKNWEAHKLLSVNKEMLPGFLTDGPFFKIKNKFKRWFFLREMKTKDQSCMATECKTCNLVTLKGANGRVG